MHTLEFRVLEFDVREHYLIQWDRSTDCLPGHSMPTARFRTDGAVSFELIVLFVGVATTWPVLLQFHDEELFADFGIVVVDEVATVCLGQLFTESNGIQRLVVEVHRRVDVFPVVVGQDVYLFFGQHSAWWEGEVFNPIPSHVELQQLQTGGSCDVIEVVDGEQVNLFDKPVTVPDDVTEPVVGIDDRHRLVVQIEGGWIGMIEEVMEHRIVEVDIVEPDHPCVGRFEHQHEAQ